MPALQARRPGIAQWALWSTTARVVVTRPETLEEAQALIRIYLDAVDQACSRFRPDSELRRAEHHPAGVRIGPLLTDLVGAALVAAARTDGAVDPTVGGALCDLGYDRDLAELTRPDEAASQRSGTARILVSPMPHWRQVSLARDDDGGWLSMAEGIRLDLGATAKAFAADRCAEAVAGHLDTGVLVSLGGDIATAGPAPEGGWRIRVQDRSGDPACTVHVPAGAAVATSSTVSRRWRHRGAAMHHIVDPRTGRPASTRWRSATVAAADCVQANAASTAALVHGDEAQSWLRRTGLPARLVGADARVWTCGGWPEPESAVDGGERR